MQRCVDGMTVFLIAVGLALIAAPGCAQESGSNPPKPIGTLTVGWTYLWADQGAHYRANLNGWWVKPTVNLPHGLFAFFSSTNYYGTNAKGSVNSHGFTGGVGTAVLSRPKIKLTVYAEAGGIPAMPKVLQQKANVNPAFLMIAQSIDKYGYAEPVFPKAFQAYSKLAEDLSGAWLGTTDASTALKTANKDLQGLLK